MKTTNSGVIFDMDGTLIDSNETHVECWLGYAAREGVVVERDRVNRTFGMVNREIIRTFWPGELTSDRIAEIADGKEAMVRDAYRRHFPAMSGAAALVRTLYDHGFRLAVGSSGPKENVELACELLGISPLLDAVITGSDVKRGKPHPEIFLAAARQIGVPARQCVVVEDAAVGIEAARAAGMKCVAILSTGHVESELKDADRIVRSLDEITPPFLRQLLAVS